MAPAVKLDIIIPEDHRLEVDLPAELPSGPAEIIVRPVRRTSGAGSMEPSESSETPGSLADLFASHIGLIDSGGDRSLSEDGGEKLTDALEAKRRAGHL